MQNLDPIALDCLAALADERSFERAALRLSVTQSAVSQRLRALETQVGQPLVVRSRPLALTEAGKVLLRFARQWHALRAELGRALGAVAAGERVPVAVNADSLATWVPAALDPLVQAGLREGYGLELVVDDQDFTHEWLRQGAVLGCVSTVDEALRGCALRPLGVMHYTAVASPRFVQAQLPRGLGPDNFARVPFLVYNRKDDMQAQWVTRACGVVAPRLQERYVPSSEAYVRAAALGWGIGVAPWIQVREAVAAGTLLALAPAITVPVALYWHQWRFGEADAGAPGLVERIGLALVQGAQAVLSAADARPAAVR